jgi:hypothetical protein
MFLNNQYFRELKNEIIDYVVKLNLEYFMFSDLKHICNRSEFRRLCLDGFFTKKIINNNHNNPYWEIRESERPILLKTLKFKR